MHRYAQARLRLSVVYLLIFWLLALLAVILQVPTWLQSLTPHILPQAALLIFWGAYILLSMPLDYLGGWYLPHKYGRHTLAPMTWWLGWLRGVGLQGFVFAVSALLLIVSARWLDWGGALGAFGIMLLLLTGFQLFIARGLAPFSSKVESDRGAWVYYLDNPDRSFTGGIFGMPGQEYIVMPMYWRDKFPEAIHQILLDRRHGAINTGSHGRGVLIAFLSNLLLFAAALLCTRLTPQDGLWMAEVALWFTVWAAPFHVAVLPWLSRRGVLEVDRWAFYKGLDADVLRASFEKVHRLQEDYGAEGVGGGWLQPTPTQAMRLQSLAEQQPVKGAWQATRYAVFTSWAGLNLLARALPPQIGRPALWVFLPGD